MVASDRFIIFCDDDCDDGVSMKRDNHQTIGLNYEGDDPDEPEKPNLRRIRRQRLQSMKLCLKLSLIFLNFHFKDSAAAAASTMATDFANTSTEASTWECTCQSIRRENESDEIKS